MDLGLSSSTVADARKRFAGEFFPRDETDIAFLDRLNEVNERYHSLEKWVGSQATFRVDVSEEKTFYLPYYLDSVAAASIDKRPAITQSERYQFIHDGPGEVDANGSIGGVLIDLGLSGIQAPFPETASTLTFSAALQTADEGKKIRVLGYDTDGNWVTDAAGTPGEEVTIGDAPVVTSTVFSGVKGVQKEFTVAAITLTHTTDDVELLRAEPFMENPMFRGYRILDLSAEAIFALCKRRAIPVTKEEDYLFPGNLSALKQGMFGLVYENAGDMGKAQQYFREGVTLLNNEATSYRGGAQEQLEYAPWGPGVGGIDNMM